jgi:thiamine pyrophosphokinase
MIDENNTFEMIDKAIRLKGAVGEFISLIPVSDSVVGITTRGLKYPLHAETIIRVSSRGISNEFAMEEAEITIDSGLLLVILARD